MDQMVDMSKRVNQIASEDRIPAREKFAFSVGQGSDYYGHTAITERLWLPFYNIGLGLSPALAGMLLVAFRLVEAFASPLVGAWSDNTRSRWGRRRPWIALGAVVSAISFPFLFVPSPAWGQTTIVAYTLVVGGIFFFAYTVWSVPFYALGLELTPNYDERTRLGAWMAFAAKLMSIPASWILLFASGSLFISGLTGKPDILAGLWVFSLLAAPIILLLGVLPALLIKERFADLAPPKEEQPSLAASFRASASCRPLWPLTATSVLLIMGFSASRSVGTYVNIYYVFDGDLAAGAAMEGLKSTLTLALGVVLLPLLTKLSDRYDKRQVIIGLLVFAALGNLLNIVCLTPDRPYLQLVPALAAAGLASSVWMFFPAMKADVADYDELQTGQRREGSLNAFYLWCFKLSLVASAGMDGLLLSATGFRVEAARQSPETLGAMVLIYTFLPAAIWLFGALVLLPYRLNRGAMAEIRNLIEMRRPDRKDVL